MSEIKITTSGELHADNERQMRAVQRLLTLGRKRLAAIGGAGGPVDERLIEVEALLSRMEFET